MAIVNSSGWPTTKAITIQTREEFLSGLVHYELIGKREIQINHFRDGLELLQLATLMKSYPIQLKSVLVYDQSKKLDAATFLAQVAAVEPLDPVHKRVYQYFQEYVNSKDAQGEKVANMVLSVTTL